MNKSKRKGDNFEREVVHEAQAFGLKAYRFFCSRSPLENKVDVMLAGYKVQCKKKADGFREIYKAIEDVDLLVLGADYKEKMVVMRFKDFLKLIGE